MCPDTPVTSDLGGADEGSSPDQLLTEDTVLPVVLGAVAGGRGPTPHGVT